MYHFSWFFLVPGFGEHGEAIDSLLMVHDEASGAHAILAAWFVVLLILVASLMANAGLKAAREKGGTLQYVPETNLGARNVMELMVGGLLSFAEQTIGSRDIAVRYFPLFGTLFIYILISNLMGVVPGFLPPTSSISNNYAMALVVFFVFNYAGFKEVGMGYLKHIAGPVAAIAPVLFVLESVSILLRPVTLSVRLYINMFADHLLLGVSSEIIPLVLPSLFTGLGIFVSFVQAYVFMLLAVVYVTLSVAHDDDHH
ncbi:MAG: F0F1 ATP synthase subunit A [Alphaproteobacteria bacterium]|nr:F0F1 ATP synthase subunit A [Alphaproteobacteria bacterium]